MVLEVWFCRIRGSNDVQDEFVYSVHRRLHEMIRKQADTCQIKGDLFTENKTASDFILMPWFRTGLKKVFGAERQFLSSLLVSYTCMYKSGTHDFFHCSGPHVPEVTENHLGQKDYSLSESSFLIKLIRTAISPPNLFSRVVTSDMKYSS